MELLAEAWLAREAMDWWEEKADRLPTGGAGGGEGGWEDLERLDTGELASRGGVRDMSEGRNGEEKVGLANVFLETAVGGLRAVEIQFGQT